MPEHVRRAIAETMGIEDLTLFDILRTFGIVHHKLDQIGEMIIAEPDISMARHRLLMRLRVAEKLGHKVSPTELSHYRHVSRNTISALLKGLEDQGLIERTLDPEDRRRFYIQLTDIGRETVEKLSPRMAVYVNEVFSALTPEERDTLLALLNKLRGILAQILDQNVKEDTPPKQNQVM